VFAHLRGNIADDAMQMDVHKTLYPFYTTKKVPHCYGNNHKKRFVGSNSQINNITSYTVGYLQIYNVGHFFSSKRKHCHDL